MSAAGISPKHRFTCYGGGHVQFVEKCYTSPVLPRSSLYENKMMKTWKSMQPGRQRTSRESRRHLQTSLASYGLEIDHNLIDDDEDKMNIVPRAHTSSGTRYTAPVTPAANNNDNNSKMELVVLEQDDRSRLPLTPSPDFDCVLTSYFPYRRSGYIDHMIRQSKVNSARVMLCDNPDAMTLRCNSASVLAGKYQNKKGARQDVESSNQQLLALPAPEEERSTPWVETKEYTKNSRNRFYSMKSPKTPAKDTVKAVRFDGGVSEAEIVPITSENSEKPYNRLTPSSAEDLEYNGIGTSTDSTDDFGPFASTRKRHKQQQVLPIKYADKREMIESPEFDHIPFNIYHGRNYMRNSGILPNRAKEYDFHTEKVLSYYIAQETKTDVPSYTHKFPTAATVNFNVGENGPTPYTPPPSRSSGLSRRGFRPSAKFRKSKLMEEVGAGDGDDGSGGFIKIQKQSILHNREKSTISNKQPEPKDKLPEIAKAVNPCKICDNSVKTVQEVKNTEPQQKKITTITVRL